MPVDAVGSRRLDAWAMNLWPVNAYKKLAFEVKISLEDFKRELELPAKRRPALALSNKFFFATPAGLVGPEDVPAETGLVWVDQMFRVQQIKAAPFREIEPLPPEFLASLLRRRS